MVSVTPRLCAPSGGKPFAEDDHRLLEAGMDVARLNFFRTAHTRSTRRTSRP